MSRRDEVMGRVARGTNRRNADQARVRAVIQRFVNDPDWSVLLDFLDHREKARTAVSDEGDAGALLRAAGRRSFLRELERLDERVTDDDRSDQHG